MFPAEGTASAEAGAQAAALAVCVASPKFPFLASSSLLATTLSRAHGNLCKAGPHDPPSRRFCLLLSAFAGLLLHGPSSSRLLF